jgi:hypothetical protein
LVCRDKGAYAVIHRRERAYEFATNEYNPRVGTRLLSTSERVHVWEIRLNPGERIGFHRHVLDSFWTAITPGKALAPGRWNDVAGQTKTLRLWFW